MPTAPVYRITLILLILAAFSGGLLLAVRASSDSTLQLLLPTPTATPELKVFVSGEVRRPGVYTLAQGDRVMDAVEAAGGATKSADLSQVNMAQRVRDQDHFHIPSFGEELPSPAPQAIAKININTATVEELIALPDIGPVRAGAIVSYLETNGLFLRIDQLISAGHRPRHL